MLEFRACFGDKGKSNHPTEKPVPLLEFLVKTYSNENDTVLDNCAGSMSTVIAALNTKRNCIAIEKDTKYFEIGKERVTNHIKINHICFILPPNSSENGLKVKLLG